METNRPAQKILLIGGTGMLGKALTERLVKAAHQVTVMSRRIPKDYNEVNKDVKLIYGDLIRPLTLEVAIQGQDIVVVCAHAMLGRGKYKSEKVDGLGHRQLIDIALKNGVRQFIYISILGARPDHPVDFWRTKWQVEQYLKQSGMQYTIIRPAAFMEMHAYELIGKGVLKNGKAFLIGKGDTPINFVSMQNVADLIALTVGDERYSKKTIEIGGIDHISRAEVAQKYAVAAGKKLKLTRLPVAVAQVIAAVIGPFHPGIRRVIKVTVDSEAKYEPFNVRPLLQEIPIQITRIDDFIRDG